MDMVPFDSVLSAADRIGGGIEVYYIPAIRGGVDLPELALVRKPDGTGLWLYLNRSYDVDVLAEDIKRAHAQVHIPHNAVRHRPR
jgi:hypothetical protein